jgi:hypothetical protein
MAPVLVATAFYLKIFRSDEPVFYQRIVVKLPTETSPSSWESFSLYSFVTPAEMDWQASRAVPASRRDFVLRVLPGLVNVLCGQLALVGVPSRTRTEIGELPHDWQTLYLAGKAGLVTEASLYGNPQATEEDLYAAETYYVASAGWRHDFRVMLSYLGRAFFPFLYPARRRARPRSRTKLAEMPEQNDQIV